MVGWLEKGIMLPYFFEGEEGYGSTAMAHFQSGAFRSWVVCGQWWETPHKHETNLYWSSGG